MIEIDEQDIIDREGQWCPIPSCKGTMEWSRRYGESCSCHISAPCSACMNMIMKCTHCGHELDLDDPEYLEECLEKEKINPMTEWMEI